MAENNLGSLHYSLNIDLDPRTLAKIQSELDKIETIKRFGSGGGNTSGVGGSSTPKENDGLEKQKQLYEEINKLIQQSTGASSEKAEQIVKEQMALAELKNQRELLNQAEKAGAVSAEQSIKLRGEIAEKEILHRNALSEVTREIKNEITAHKSEAGSVNEMQSRVNELTLAWNRLSKAKREGIEGQTIKKEVDTLKAQLNVAYAGVNRVANGMYGLNYSIQQVAREIPNWAISPQMFIMAISNNLPILQDELRKTRLQNEALKASGQATVPIWKQIIKSIISWQTALVAIITVGTVFGKQITEWAGRLFSVGQSAKYTREEHEKLVSEFKKESLELDALFSKLKSTNISTENRIDAINKINDKYGDYLSNLITEKSTLEEIATAQENATKALMANISLKNNNEKLSAVFKDISEDFSKNFSGFIKKVGEVYGADRVSDFVTRINKAIDDKIKAGGGKVDRGILEYSKLAQDVYGEFVEDISRKSGFLEYDFKSFQDAFLDFAKFKAGKASFINAIEGMNDSYQDFLNSLKGNKGRTIEVIDQEIERLQKAQKEYSKTAVEYKSYQDQIDKLTKEKDTITGKKEKLSKFVDTDKQTRDRQRNARDIEYSVAQAGIDAMEDGNKKKLAQMELNHRREMDMLDREKEDSIQKIVDNAKALFNADPKNKGKKFNYTGIGLSAEEEGNFNLLRQATTDKQTSEVAKFYKETYEDLAKMFFDSQDKIDAINREYSKKYETLELYKTKISEEEYNKRKAVIDKFKSEEITAISNEILQLTSSYQKLFTDISDLSEKEISFLINKWNNALSSAKRNSDNTFSFSIDGKDFTTTEQQMASLVKKIKEAEDEVRDRNPFKALKQSFEDLKANSDAKSFIKNQIKSLQTSIDTSDSQKEIEQLLKEIERLKEALGETETDSKTKWGNIANDIDKANSLVAATSDSISSVMDSFGASEGTKGTLEDIMGIAQGVGDTGAGIARIMSGDVIGGVTQAIKGIAGIITSINSLADRDNEKRIKELQKEIDKTSVKYEELGRSAERAMSGAAKETKEAQIALLKYQQQLIRQQIREEEEKKKTDKDKIEQWKDDLRQIGYDIEDLYAEITDSIVGDIQGLANEMASAIVDAAKEGGDAWESAFESINKWIEEAIVNLYRMSVVEPALEGINKRMKQMLSLDDKDTSNDKNKLTQDQVKELIGMAEDAADNATDIFESGGWADLINALSTGQNDSDSSLSQAIKGIQESNPGLIEAYLNTIREMVIAQKIGGENLLSVAQASQHIQSQALSELQAINSNTQAMVNAFKSVVATSSSDNGSGLRVFVK